MGTSFLELAPRRKKKIFQPEGCSRLIIELTKNKERQLHHEEYKANKPAQRRGTEGNREERPGHNPEDRRGEPPLLGDEARRGGLREEPLRPALPGLPASHREHDLGGVLLDAR